MAENSNLILEAKKRYLNENENSLFLDSEFYDNVDSSISRNSAATADNCSLGQVISSFQSECLTSTRNDFSEFHRQDLLKYSEIGGSISTLKSSSDLIQSLNNTVAEDIFSAVPNPDFIKNSPSSEDGSSSEMKPDNFRATPVTEKDHPLPSSFTADEKIFKFPELSKLISISNNPNDVCPTDVFSCLSKSSADAEENFEGEEFLDAVQLFKDPFSLQYLENMETSGQEEEFIPRNSLLINFDPLHKAVGVPTYLTGNSNVHDKNSDTLDKKMEDETIEVTEISENDSSIPLVLKPLPKSLARESFGNILLSFDSPLKINSTRNSQKGEDSATESKLYTEEELQQILKINELTIQEKSLKNQRDLEEECHRKITEKDEVIKHNKQLCLSFHQTAEELASLLLLLKEGNQPLLDTIKELESENQKLRDDLKTSNEDLQSVEHTFSDLHKRYVQCKDMLETYKDNENLLKEKVDSLNKQIEEKKQMYNILQTRTEEMVSKANTEVANAKKGEGDPQNAVLKAKLKKSELRISSLENDLNQVKIENRKLSGIVDDLMAKVSEG